MTAILALADSTVFEGEAFGAATVTVGEVVFNTSMTGYQEIITDPSYRGQMVVMTVRACRQHRDQSRGHGIAPPVAQWLHRARAQPGREQLASAGGPVRDIWPGTASPASARSTHVPSPAACVTGAVCMAPFAPTAAAAPRNSSPWPAIGLAHRAGIWYRK